MAGQHRILLVEDEEAHAELVRRGLEDSADPAELVVAKSLAEARRALAEDDDVDLVLTDFLLPDGRGTELVTECVELEIPAVLLTSHGDETVAVEAMKAGALDYVVKSPETLSDMAHIATRSLREWGHIQEQKRLESQLLQSQKLEAIGQLSSGIAHDFNNLLMAITGCADLALRRLGEHEPAAEFVREIKSAAKRGARLSNQLVTFSRRVDPHQGHTFDLNDVIGRSRSLLQPLLGANVNVKMALAPRPLPVCCHPSQLEQVLFNLVVNARDAMPAGGTVTIGTEAVTVEPWDSLTVEPGDHIVLTVEDTGVGIDAETRGRIFEPFFTTKPVGKGTGLGLSTVYGIVRQAGGEIVVDSEPGAGTAFRIFIPESKDEIQSEVEDESVASPRGNETVLLVDDDRIVRLTMRTYLAQAGYDVIEASDGRDALKKVESADLDVDILVTDISMPGKPDGLGLVNRLRETSPSLPVVFVTGHGSAPLEKEDPLATEPFLWKPVDEHDLLRAVRLGLDAVDDGAPEEPHENQTATSRPRVLLVEDHDLSRATTCALLDDMGFDAVGASTGADALDQLASHPPDIVVIDLGLPDVGGRELADQMRKTDPDLAILFVSGRDDDDPRVHEALQLPRARFLQKPFEIEGIGRTIEEMTTSTR